MASLKLWFSLLLVLTSLLSIHASYSSFEDNAIGALESQKVNLSLYYETLCPACASFIVNDLAAKLFDPNEDLISIIKLRLVPYGNAQVKEPNKTIICQHGLDECYFNSIEACAIHLWPDVVRPSFYGLAVRNVDMALHDHFFTYSSHLMPCINLMQKQHFDFIHCLERKLIEGVQPKERAWESCCEELKMDPERLGQCYQSGYVKKLILQNANETEHLVPPHEYVPWVVVNGQPLKDDFKNFVTHVCNAYKDSPKPKACGSQPHHSLSSGKANSRLEAGCYKDERGGS